MLYTVQKNYHFYAAHRNMSAGEKCARIHGHTYDVVCHFGFEETGDGGVTCLFSDIDAKVEPIIKDHCHYLLLYTKDPLGPILDEAEEPYIALPFETSAENMAKYFFDRILSEAQLPIYRIELRETKSSNVIYEPYKKLENL